MPTLLSDWVAAAYTQYDQWFAESYNSYNGPDYSPLYERIELGDNQGDRIDLNWLGAPPQLRAWTDEKRPKGLNSNRLQLIVRDFEATIELNRNSFKDGKWRQYESRIRMLAETAQRHPWKLLSDLIQTNGICYDGQNFFDTDHSEGSSGQQANVISGSGTSMANIQDDWFKAQYTMQQFKDDQGELWGIDGPDFVIHPPQLNQQFERLMEQQLVNGGESNVMRGKFRHIPEARLTDTNDWYAFFTGGAMKPFLFLEREAPHPVNLVDPTMSEEAFMRKRMFFSVEARREVGYGLWQYAIKITN